MAEIIFGQSTGHADDGPGGCSSDGRARGRSCWKVGLWSGRTSLEIAETAWATLDLKSSLSEGLGTTSRLRSFPESSGGDLGCAGSDESSSSWGRIERLPLEASCPVSSCKNGVCGWGEVVAANSERDPGVSDGLAFLVGRFFRS